MDAVGNANSPPSARPTPASAIGAPEHVRGGEVIKGEAYRRDASVAIAKAMFQVLGTIVDCVGTRVWFYFDPQS